MPIIFPYPCGLRSALQVSRSYFRFWMMLFEWSLDFPKFRPKNGFAKRLCRSDLWNFNSFERLITTWHQFYLLLKINEYCGARRGKHAALSSDRDVFFGKNTLKESKKMTFKHTGRFAPDRLKSDPKTTFSRPASLPNNEWCSHPKAKKMTFLDQSATTIWALRRQVQDQSTRGEIDSYVRRFTSGRPA